MLPFDADALRHHRQLVGRMAEGDVRALREFFGLHAERVQGVVGRILRNREEAREAVQDTFVKAWQRAAGYRAERGEAVAWLILIARNTAIDRLRAERRRLGREAGWAGQEEEVLPAAAAGAGAAGADVREELEQELAVLTANQREAIQLAFFGGCSQAEIAARMRQPVTAVKNHLHRGLAKLRQRRGLLNG